MMSQYAIDAWVRSGQAATAARSLMWFVIIAFVVIAYVLWKDSK